MFSLPSLNFCKNETHGVVMLTLDQICVVLGLAMSCASFFAIFFSNKVVRVIVVLVALLVSSITTYSFYKFNNEKRLTDIATLEAMLIKRTNEFSTFDDVFANTYYPSFENLEVAVDNLVYKGSLEFKQVKVEYDGKSHAITLYKAKQ